VLSLSEQQYYNPYAEQVDKAEENRKIVEEYLMGPESVQVATVIVEYLQSWEFLFLVGLIVFYRLAVKAEWYARIVGKAMDIINRE